mmetsp:Transcript_34936/g.103503  ORF Transcript_34936/g.103503 Transcript_34936/m.103503 type:complete len:237 (-) Transcript_34936:1051-1761(-)
MTTSIQANTASFSDRGNTQNLEPCALYTLNTRCRSLVVRTGRRVSSQEEARHAPVWGWSPVQSSTPSGHRQRSRMAARPHHHGSCPVHTDMTAARPRQLPITGYAVGLKRPPRQHGLQFQPATPAWTWPPAAAQMKGQRERMLQPGYRLQPDYRLQPGCSSSQATGSSKLQPGVRLQLGYRPTVAKHCSPALTQQGCGGRSHHQQATSPTATGLREPTQPPVAGRLVPACPRPHQG